MTDFHVKMSFSTRFTHWGCAVLCCGIVIKFAFFQLNEEKRLLEQRRLQEEKAKAEIRLQLEEMERQRKEKEEKKRQDIEKQGKHFTDGLLFEWFFCWLAAFWDGSSVIGWFLS